MLPWIIWALAALFVVLNYVQQVFPNIIAQELTGALHASHGTLGHIAAAYFFAYAALQIPVGLTVDRFGARRPLVLAILTAGAGAIAFAFTQNAESALLARLLMGAGSAFSFLGCLKLVQEWFPIAQFSTLAGMTNTAAMLGAAGGAPLAWWVSKLGWRETMIQIGAIELLLGILVLLVVRERPSPEQRPTAHPVETPTISMPAVWSVLRNPQVWINATYATTISLIFVAFGGLWGVSFIRKAYALDAVAAANVSSILFLGGIFGSLLFGWYSDYLRSRRKPMMLAAAGAFLTLCPLLYVPEVPLQYFNIGLFLIGFFSSANIIAYAVARDLYPSLSGLSIGFLSTFFYAGSAVSQPLVGFLLEYHARDGSGVGLDFLTVADYRFALSALVIFIAIGILASLLIRETVART